MNKLEREMPPRSADFMNRKVQTIPADTPLDEVVEFLLSHHLSNAPVVEPSGDGDVLVGFLSERDCLEAIAHQSFFDMPGPATAREIMKTNPVCLSPETDVFAAAAIFIHQGFRHLPVTDKGRLLGIVSRRDVLRAVSDYSKRVGLADLRERFPPDMNLRINRKLNFEDPKSIR